MITGTLISLPVIILVSIYFLLCLYSLYQLILKSVNKRKFSHHGMYFVCIFIASLSRALQFIVADKELNKDNKIHSVIFGVVGWTFFVMAFYLLLFVVSKLHESLSFLENPTNKPNKSFLFLMIFLIIMTTSSLILTKYSKTAVFSIETSIYLTSSLWMFVRTIQFRKMIPLEYRNLTDSVFNILKICLGCAILRLIFVTLLLIFVEQIGSFFNWALSLFFFFVEIIPFACVSFYIFSLRKQQNTKSDKMVLSLIEEKETMSGILSDSNKSLESDF
ncbi:hypothetical protein M0813_09929 [Anaeramoeba flamelloides]|uniref:THH1/TOM1/TOM3 domain-containing protein n=1 Tax=Anaeramoeba flamelloides TaxID=1746091 RepID=A0ABQ8X409_9EUKA|nr:hypothetical protein M0813_09929 [Anaeramoeba flamelloides]